MARAGPQRTHLLFERINATFIRVKLSLDRGDTLPDATLDRLVDRRGSTVSFMYAGSQKRFELCGIT